MLLAESQGQGVRATAVNRLARQDEGPRLQRSQGGAVTV